MAGSLCNAATRTAAVAVLESTAPGMRVVLAGEVDLACKDTLDAVLAQIAASPAADVSADLSDVTFLASTGLDFLVQLHLGVVSGGHTLSVLGPRPEVCRALQVTGVGQLLHIHDACGDTR